MPTSLASFFTVFTYLAASRVVPQVKNKFSSPKVGAVNFALGSVVVAPLDVRPLRWFFLRLTILDCELLDFIEIMLTKHYYAPTVLLVDVPLFKLICVEFKLLR